jgi:membrane fusion protein (multidrug efflux system)
MSRSEVHETTGDGARPSQAGADAAPPVKPVATRYVVRIGVAAAIALAGLFLAGLLPRRSQQRLIAAEVTSAAAALPVVAVATAQRPSGSGSLLLPGTMEALHESALYARASGYVRRWYADIGTTVRAGQLLAEIDVPELEQNVLQARAHVAQMQSALVLAQANLARWRLLAADSAVTEQELQQMQQTYDAASASVRAAEANLRALLLMQRYTRIAAPFAGVVVARNVDDGAFITASGASSTPLTAGGSELATATAVAAASLFRVAQTDTMRVYISVPQPYLASVTAGLGADLLVQDLPGRAFRGTVARTAGAVDPSTRTLLVEVDVPNPDRALLPGMYAQVRIQLAQADPPIVLPSTALLFRSAGPQVIEVRPAGDSAATVHFRSVEVGRDYGSTIEILSGVSEGEKVATIGSQVLAEGQRVRIAGGAGDSTKVGGDTSGVGGAPRARSQGAAAQ